MTTPDTTRLAEIRARFVRTDTPEGVFCSWGRDDVATLLSLVEQLQTENEALRAAPEIIDNPKADRINSLVRSSTRLVRIERDAARADVEQLQGQLAKGREIHKPFEARIWFPEPGTEKFCVECSGSDTDGGDGYESWPCPTAKALGLGEEATEDEVQADAAPVIVYGASDDLIEVGGAVDDELNPPYNKPTFVIVHAAISTELVQVRLRVEYDPDGTGEWRIAEVSGHGLVTIVPARGEDEGDDGDGCPGYSDKAVVRGGVSVELEGADDA